MSVRINRKNNVYPSHVAEHPAIFGQAIQYNPLYLILRPLTTCGSFLGLLPLQDIWNRRGPTGFSWCSLPSFYTVIIHILFFCGVGYIFGGMLTSMQSDANSGAALDRILISVFMSMSFASSLFNIIYIYVKAKKQAELYEDLRHLEAQMAFSASSENRTTLTLKQQLLSPLLIVYLVSSITLASSLLMNKIPTGFARVVYTFNCVNILGTQFFPFLHAAGLCVVASALYGRLNNYIKEVLSSASFSGEGSSCADHHPQIKVAMRGESTLAAIEHCRHVQHLLSSFSNKISETFTPAFLISTPTFFIFTCYYLYDVWGMVGSGKDCLTLLLSLIYAVNNLVCLGIISWTVDLLRDQHEQTASEVHKCRTAVLTDATVSALQHFSLQLIHSSPQLPVAGFFAVDRSFLLAMIGNLATYLVILIQFRGS